MWTTLILAVLISYLPFALCQGHGTLFLATGFSGSSGDSSSDDVSIDSLLDPEAGCISEVDAYPPNSIQHAVGAFVDGRPFVCGGVRPATGLIDARCHSYDPMLNCWAVHPTEMQVPRSHAAGVMINDTAWLVIGGRDRNNTVLSTAELYTPQSGFILKDLPAPIADHCVAKIGFGNRAQVFAAGLDLETNMTALYRLDMESKKWTLLGKHDPGRNFAFCGTLWPPDTGERLFILAGGESPSGQLFDDTQIYHVNKGQWINAGANLPLAVSRGVSLEYGHDAFLAIGGVVGSGLSAENRVYKFNVANMNWEQITTLVQGKASHVAIFVPQNYLDVCSVSHDGNDAGRLEDFGMGNRIVVLITVIILFNAE